MIVVEVARNTLESEKASLLNLEESSKGTPVHAYILGALSLLDWLNAGERPPSSHVIWMLHHINKAKK